MGHVHVHKSSAQRGPRSLSKTRGRWAGSLSTLNITILLESALGLPSGLHGDEGRPVAMRGPLVVAPSARAQAWLQAPGKPDGPQKPRQQVLLAQPTSQVRKLRPRAAPGLARDPTASSRGAQLRIRVPATGLASPRRRGAGGHVERKTLRPASGFWTAGLRTLREARGRDAGQRSYHLRERRPLEAGHRPEALKEKPNLAINFKIFYAVTHQK